MDFAEGNFNTTFLLFLPLFKRLYKKIFGGSLETWQNFIFTWQNFIFTLMHF